ncbi:hypothetical protein M9H77_22425 [Catharanthus roseus]|uniref:Uncharacterized protein n=1 Tax=Catharanthus roseus TaxID=4058 RepID=A0ACC0AQ30_CATRO|nr:hypothetical protein M9H77_22425 [Catharanthus roseus]
MAADGDDPWNKKSFTGLFSSNSASLSSPCIEEVQQFKGKPLSPDFQLAAEPSTKPAWIDFEEIPIHLFNKGSLFSIARAVERPLDDNRFLADFLQWNRLRRHLHCSHIWLCISSVHASAEELIGVKLRRGHASFWFDQWLPSRRLSRDISLPSSKAKRLSIDASPLSIPQRVISGTPFFSWMGNSEGSTMSNIDGA